MNNPITILLDIKNYLEPNLNDDANENLLLKINCII
jgi:hypothetical protein